MRKDQSILGMEQYAEITLLTSNDIVVVYVDDVALCGRCYAYTAGHTGVFVEYGEVQIDEFEVLRKRTK